MLNEREKYDNNDNDDDRNIIIPIAAHLSHVCIGLGRKFENFRKLLCPSFGLQYTSLSVSLSLFNPKKAQKILQTFATMIKFCVCVFPSRSPHGIRFYIQQNRMRE